MKFLNKYILYYILSVLIFGVIYFGFWLLKPGSFIFHKELNLNPFEEEILISSESIEMDLTDFTKIAIEIQNKHNNLIKELIKSSELNSNIDYQIKVLSEQNSKQWKINTDNYISRAKNKSTHKKKMESIGIKMDSIKNLKFPNVIDSIESTIEISNLRVDSFRLNVFYNQDISQAYSNIMSNIGSFNDKELSTKIDSLEKDDYSIDGKINEIESEIRDLVNKKRQLKFDYIKQNSNRLSIFDFIYFSASNASTVTYGEIVPNSKLLRLIIMGQVLTCLIFFGGYINRLFEKDNNQ